MDQTSILDLFSPSSVTIRRVGPEDANRGTDLAFLLKDRLLAHQEMYPSIGRWVDEKVLPGIKTGERLGYVGFQGDRAVLTAVIKKGKQAKFCHLSIDQGFQGNELGQLMFVLMSAEVHSIAKEIHFTLPESLWHSERSFFQSFGFGTAKIAKHQYRLFEEELRCSAPIAVVWKSALAKLPRLLTNASISGFDLGDGIVLSVQERFAKSIMNGTKTVELRRRFSNRWAGREASVYASGGSGCLYGLVKIDRVTRESPDDVWVRFAAELDCSLSEYREYVGDRSTIYALHLTHPKPYQAPVTLSQLSYLVGHHLTPPQSYSCYSPDNKWGTALSVAALLHRNTRSHNGSSRI